MPDNPKISIYFDKELVKNKQNYIQLLYPFLGYPKEDDGFVDKGRFLEYVKSGKEYFNIADSIEKCDVVCYPLEYHDIHIGKDEFKKYCADIWDKYRKKILIFFNNDSDEEIDIESAIIFRTSFDKSKQKFNEFAEPGWSKDYISYFPDSKISYRKKSDIPTVGYCGYDDSSERGVVNQTKKLLKKALGRYKTDQSKTGIFLRGEAVRRIKRNKRINGAFIIRNSFWGMNNKNKKSVEELRAEYAGNIIDSDYCIVTRGGGNFSYRLYEVLSAGRIPLFINTDSVLPYDQIVDWKKNVVWVERNDLKNIDKILLSYHSKISEEEFIKIQQNNRKLYEELISPVGYFGNLHKIILPLINKE